MFLQRLTVWQRLSLLLVTSALALTLLIWLSIDGLLDMDAEIHEMADRTQAQRYSQGIIVRAQDMRSEILLALQHNPSSAEIQRLHDHSLSRHLDGLDKATKELTESIDLLKQTMGSPSAEAAPMIETLQKEVANFVQSIDPARRKLAAEQYVDANILLLKQINPAFSTLRQAAVALNDHVANAATEQAKQAKAHSRSDMIMTLVIGILAIALGSAIGLAVARSIVRQLGGEPDGAIAHMEKVASGDLTVRTGAPSGSLLAALDGLTGGLNGMVRQVHSRATEVANHSNEIARTAREVAQAANVESEATSSMAAAVEQLTVSINHLADMADESERLAQQTHTLALGGETQVREAAQEMNRIAGDVKVAWEQVTSLDGSAGEISSVAQVIKEIANQTNLLALNAAIEAARAGESGRGFAVVADEVRKLAERTTLATGDIDKMITAIQDKTGGIASSMNDMLPQVERGTASAQLAAQSLEQISEASEQILHRTRDSVSASHEQRQASNAIAQRVEQIAQMVEETSAAMRNASESAGHTGQLAVDLKSMVERFRI